METWKVKKRQPAKKSGGGLWKTRVLGVLLVLATVGGALYDFPMIWNQGAEAVQAKTGWSAPRIAEVPFRLGLDLQGGTHLVYEADMKDIPAGDRGEALEGVRDVIERRVNAFGVSEPIVQTTTTGGTYRVIVELAGILDVAEAIKQIGETPILEFKVPGQSLDREPTVEEQATLDARQKEDRATADLLLKDAQAGKVLALAGQTLDWQEIPNVNTSIDVYKPMADAIIAARTTSGRIVPKVVETPDGLSILKVTEVAQAKEMQLSHLLMCFEGKDGCTTGRDPLDANIQIGNIAKEATTANFAELVATHSDDMSSEDGSLGWVGPGETVPAFEIAALALKSGEISAAVETNFGYHLILKQAERAITNYKIERVVLPLTSIYDIVPQASPWTNTALSGKQLKRASVQFDPNTGAPFISLQFDKEGGDLFGEITAAHIGQPIGIFLDGEAISTPTVQQAIYGGEAIITGDSTLDEAKILAQRLNAGALPVPVSLLSQETVGPTLGIASLQASLKAALIGFLLVSLFMVLVYRLPGFLAVLALVLYAVLNILIYRLFDVTITLSGIAGLVLSLGIAVDANVLIFERMKDEFRSGRDLVSAIDEGFKRAWPPIRDGHMTTLISALVLYGFSSSFVKGFALTLAVGVILSLFTAIIVTRVYMKNTRAMKFLRAPFLYALKRSSSNEPNA